MSFEYLASPYTHPDPAVRQYRYEQAVYAASILMREGRIIFSPIAHSHAIDAQFSEPQSGAFWKAQDLALLRHASALLVLAIPGYDTSEGIKWEIATARAMGLSVEVLGSEYFESIKC